MQTTKHSLNTVVTKDTFFNFFFILYCDFVFFKSSGIDFHNFVPYIVMIIAVVCSVKLLMYIIGIGKTDSRKKGIYPGC